MENFKEELMARQKAAEEVVLKYMPAPEGLQKTVIEAMNYGVGTGGKRLRPLLMHETYVMFGGNNLIVEPFMAAIEMIHNYSLIHDDLPAMDNDEYRRGKKTTHAVFGETMGILAGDGLLNFAYETAAKSFDLSCSMREIIYCADALKVLSRKAGIYGMVGGQVVDIESEGKEIPLETLEFLHRNKCGALIEAAMLCGAMLAGASEEEKKIIEKAAGNIGLAFQVQDDILDETSTTEELGKPVGSDEKNHKSTYVSLLGLERSREIVRELSDEAIGLLKSLPYDSEFLTTLFEELVNRRY